MTLKKNKDEKDPGTTHPPEASIRASVPRHMRSLRIGAQAVGALALGACALGPWPSGHWPWGAWGSATRESGAWGSTSSLSTSCA